MIESINGLLGFIGFFIIPVVITGGTLWSILKFNKGVKIGFLEDVLSSVTLGLGTVGASILLLAEVNIFSPVSYITSIIAINVAFLIFLKRQKTLENAIVKFWLVCGMFLFVLVLLARLILPPFEQVYGGRDGGEYINQAFWLAYKGGFDFKVPFVKVLSERATELFLFEFLRYEPAGLRFLYLYPGFYWVDNNSTLEFQFFHLYPSILAAGMLASLKHSLLLTPVLGLIALLWLFVVGRSVFGKEAGLMAALFWAVNPLFTWFSRYANAEVLMLVFILAGIWGLIESAKRKGNFSPFFDFALICLGLASLTKIEALLIVAPLIITLRIISSERKNLIMPLALFALLYGWSWLHALIFSRHYLQMTLVGVIAQLTKLSITNLLACSGIIIGTILFFVLLLRKIKISLLVKIIALLWAFVGLIGYTLPVSLGIPAGLAPWGWFMSPLLVLLACIGPLFIADDLEGKVEAEKIWVLLVFAGFFMIISARFAMYGDYPWGARRTISGAMPLFTLIGVYPLVKIFEKVKQNGDYFKNMAFAILMIVPVVAGLPLDFKFFTHREYGNAMETLENFAQIFPENSIIIFEGSLPGSWLSLPLAFQKGHLPLVFWLDDKSMPTIDFEAVQEVVHKAEVYDMPVYLITLKELESAQSGFESLLVTTFHLEVPTYEFLNYGRPPLERKSWQFTLYIYRLSATLR